MTNPIAPKIVAIYGASGAQDGSVACSLLQNKSQSFQVRAITRDPSSTKSKDLQAQGATVVRADGWDKEKLSEAFQGCWAAFINTNSYDPVSRYCTSGVYF